MPHDPVTGHDPAPIVPTDVALTVAGIALDMCRKSRQAARWTVIREECAREHAFVLADLERSLLPRCEAHTVRLIRAAIDSEREALADALAR